MSNIYITMNGDNAVCTNPSEVLLTSGSVGTHKAYFDISGYNEEYAESGYEWGDLTLEAVFVASNAAYLLKENNSTIVRRSEPITKEETVVDGLGTITQWYAAVHEDVLKVPGKTLYIGLQGMNDSGEIVRCSTLAVIGKVQAGADPDGPGDGDIPSTRYDELKTAIEEMVDEFDSELVDIKSTQSSHAKQIIALNTAKTLFVPIYGDEINGYRVGRSADSINTAIDGGAQVVAYVPCQTEHPYVGESDSSVWCYVPFDHVSDGVYTFSGIVYLDDYIPRYCHIELSDLSDGFGVSAAYMYPLVRTINGNWPDESGNVEIEVGSGSGGTVNDLNNIFQTLGADDVIEINNLMGENPFDGYRLNYDETGNAPALVGGEFITSRLIVPIESDTTIYMGTGRGTVVYLDEHKNICGYWNPGGYSVVRMSEHPESAKYIMAFFPQEIYKSCRFVTVSETAYMYRGSGEIITGQKTNISREKCGALWYWCGDSIAYSANVGVMEAVAEDLYCDAVSLAMSTRGWLTSGYNIPNQIADALANNNVNLITAWGSFNDCRLEAYPTAAEIVEALKTTLDSVLAAVYASEKIPALCLILPTPWDHDEVPVETQDAYVQAMEDWCKANYIPYLDLYHFSGLNPFNESFAARYYLDTAVHPNLTGLTNFIFPKVKNFIDSNCMAANEASVQAVRTRIVVQPVAVTCAVGDTAVYNVVATGTGLTFQWQYRNATNQTWYDTTQTGYNTDTLSIEATSSRMGRFFRCKITDEDGNSVITDAAELIKAT